MSTTDPLSPLPGPRHIKGDLGTIGDNTPQDPIGTEVDTDDHKTDKVDQKPP